MKIMGNNYLEETERCLFRDNIQQCTGEAKVKVKCTFVQALRLCTGSTAHRGSRGKALPFLDHGTRRG